MKGTIIIADISGYSRFVAESDNETGSLIISRLLNAIIKENKLCLSISEIEGDAIIFYKHGSAFSTKIILSQYEAMLSSFNYERDHCKELYAGVDLLSIKLVVHYGDLGNFTVRGFTKLYGHAIVEAHRLLKNSIDSHTYVLITEEYIRQCKQKWPAHLKISTQVCELYDIGKLCYTHFNYPDDLHLDKAG